MLQKLNCYIAKYYKFNESEIQATIFYPYGLFLAFKSIKCQCI